MTAPLAGSDMRANGPPPGEAAWLYRGEVMHQRMRPFGHRFNYRVFSLAIDLDRLDEADRMAWPFSVNRFNWVSFSESDHLDGETGRLPDVARRWLREGGLEEPVHRLLLVCYPRIFGKVFNPLSVYYAYAADGRLTGLIYEVRNTFGGRHRYVCPVQPDQTTEAGIRQTQDKLFRVSPFVEMQMTYNFRMLPPGRALRWRILETDAEGPLLSATFSGERVPLAAGTLLGLCAKIPLLTATVLGGIHWEALKIWLKGAKFIPDSEKLTLATELTQLPPAKIHPRLEQDGARSRSGKADGDGLHLQLKR